MRFFRPSLLWLSAGLALSLASCDEVKEVAGDMADKAKGLVGESDGTGSEVALVTEKEGKAIIAKESRLVVVEFYSDT